MARQAAGAGGHQANLNCVIVSWTGPGQTHITHNPGLIPRDIAGHVSPSSLPELEEAEQSHSARLRSDIGDASSDGRQSRPIPAQMG